MWPLGKGAQAPGPGAYENKSGYDICIGDTVDLFYPRSTWNFGQYLINKIIFMRYFY